MKLSSEELRFFKENGFLIKRGVLDKVLMARARERFWDYTPEIFSRCEPALGSARFAQRKKKKKRQQSPMRAKAFVYITEL